MLGSVLTWVVCALPWPHCTPNSHPRSVCRTELQVVAETKGVRPASYPGGLPRTDVELLRLVARYGLAAPIAVVEPRPTITHDVLHYALLPETKSAERMLYSNAPPEGTPPHGAEPGARDRGFPGPHRDRRSGCSAWRTQSSNPSVANHAGEPEDRIESQFPNCWFDRCSRAACPGTRPNGAPPAR